MTRPTAENVANLFLDWLTESHDQDEARGKVFDILLDLGMEDRVRQLESHAFHYYRIGIEDAEECPDRETFLENLDVEDFMTALERDAALGSDENDPYTLIFLTEEEAGRHYDKEIAANRKTTPENEEAPTPAAADPDLQDRWSVANEAFQSYDMGDLVVEDTSGWEWSSGNNNVWSRTVFIANGLDVEGHGNSRKCTFVVRFAPGSVEVQEAYFAD